jgi:protein TonB
LRIEESNVLKKAMFFGVAAFITVAAIPLIMNAFQAKSTEDTTTVYYLPPTIDVSQPDIKKPEIVKIEKTPEIDARVVNTQVPTPTKNVTKEKTVAKQSDMKGAVSGFEDKEGTNTTIFVAPPQVNVPEGPEVLVKKPAVIIDDNEVKIIADVEAKFPGGLNAFRSQVGNYFDQDEFQGTGDLLKATVTFVVEKDGTISNIKATGTDASFNKEAIKTISQIKGKWIPAQVKGKNVRYAFKIPISMQFD